MSVFYERIQGYLLFNYKKSIVLLTFRIWENNFYYNKNDLIIPKVSKSMLQETAFLRETSSCKNHFKATPKISEIYREEKKDKMH